MSPIDDELRAALHGRAQVLTPSPDPLAGIERRAKRIQRNRVGAAVAGSALAVAMIAVAVPAVQNATSSNRPEGSMFATSAPSTAPDSSRYALDPQNPWTFRGTPVSDADRAMIEQEYATRTGGSAVTVTPLYAGTYESSGQTEVVFLAEVDGENRWGIAAYPFEAGLQIVWDQALPEPALALAAALPGDEAPRLVVVTSPDAGPIFYGTEGSDEATIGSAEDGVAVAAIERDTGTDFYRVLADGQTLVKAPAPDPVDITQEEPTEPRTGAALDPERPWELRGDASLLEDGDLADIGSDWAQRHDEDDVSVTPLYVQPYEPAAAVEVVYLVRAGSGDWFWGASSKGPDGAWRWYADHPLQDGTDALVAALPGDEGTERLLIVAAPFVGGAVYAADGSDFQPMTDLAMGVFISPIAPGDADDRFMVLDGNGDLDNPIAEGPAPDFQNAG